MIRPEMPEDYAAVDHLLREAFGTPAEAALVAALRHSGDAQVSLVAIEEGQVVGHVLFSTLTIEPIPSTATGTDSAKAPDSDTKTDSVSDVESDAASNSLASPPADRTAAPGDMGISSTTSQAPLGRDHTPRGNTSRLSALALAPLAVLPDFQRRGLGAALVHAGLDHCRQRETDVVIVLGDPAYYGRFGFSAARAAGLESPYAGDSFQALELRPGALDTGRGRVHYAAPFSEIE
jgi:predicted N-acetyltransferase YhbS